MLTLFVYDIPEIARKGSWTGIATIRMQHKACASLMNTTIITDAAIPIVVSIMGFPSTSGTTLP